MNPTATQPAAEPPTPVGDAGVRPDPHGRAERDARLAACVVAAAAGDCRAFEVFYDETIAYARTLARRLLRGADVDDLLADAYFEAWRGARRFDAGRGSAGSWLLAIVHSRSLDLLRRRQVHPEGADPDQAAESAADGADPIDALWQRQSQARLHTALAALNGSERWVLGLAYFRDLSHAQVARATGMPLGTVKSLLLRAQAKLRERLAATG